MRYLLLGLAIQTRQSYSEVLAWEDRDILTAMQILAEARDAARQSDRK